MNCFAMDLPTVKSSVALKFLHCRAVEFYTVELLVFGSFWITALNTTRKKFEITMHTLDLFFEQFVIVNIFSYHLIYCTKKITSKF